VLSWEYGGILYYENKGGRYRMKDEVVLLVELKKDQERRKTATTEDAKMCTSVRESAIARKVLQRAFD
jgi:hypothetical protein